MRVVSKSDYTSIAGGICEVTFKGMNTPQVIIMATAFYIGAGYLLWDTLSQENG